MAIQVDHPIEHISDDLFDRAPFARQIAKIVSTRRNSSSLVIGLYGPWGDGKTSTLSMIKECLNSNPDIITMDYNPWFYGDSTEAVTRSFFASIQTKLETSGFFSRENIGGLMANYGKSIPYLGEAVKRIVPRGARADRPSLCARRRTRRREDGAGGRVILELA